LGYAAPVRTGYTYKSSMRRIFWIPVLLLYLGNGIFLLVAGQHLIAAFWFLPGAAHGLAILFPSVGHLLFDRHIAGPAPLPQETSAQLHRRKAAWWGMGTLTLPISLLLSEASRAHGHFLGLSWEAFLTLPLPIFGAACLFKCIGAMASARKAGKAGA
jgi:hypothetical protein